MKRIISTIVMIVFAVGFFINVQEGAYTVLEIGGYDNISGADHVSDVELKKTKSVNPLKSIAPNKAFEFMGIEHEVEYQYTEKGYLYNSDTYYYEKRDERGITKFKYNCQNGRVDRYLYAPLDYLDYVDGPEKDRDECLEIARNYFSSFVNDVSEYELTSERYVESPEYRGYYGFGFSRVIDGIVTSDSASILVTVYGDIISHTFTALESMRNAKLPSQEEMDIIEENVSLKIESIYQNVRDSYNVSFRRPYEVCFMRLSDGRYALQYEIVAELTYVTEGYTISEGTRLLVYID